MSQAEDLPDPAPPIGAPAVGGASGDRPLDAAALLRDLPPVLWADVVELFRAAVPRLARSELPVAVRPYAAWRAEALAAPRPRAAVAAAMAGDDRLRAALREAHEAQGDTTPAAAALVAEGRWAELLRISTAVSDELAARRRAAQEAAARRGGDAGEDAARRLAAELRAMRAERDAARGRAEAAQRRAEQAEAERDRRGAEVEALRADVAQLERRLEDERRRGARRLARQRRRTEEAEARLRVDVDRARDVAARLAGFSRELRDALGEQGGDAVPPSEAPRAAAGFPAVPREVPAAEPGRPCGMPAGLTLTSADGVVALLRTPGILVLLDGYNVAKHARGLPAGSLPDQRLWVVRVAEGLAARYGCRMVVVFDGADAVTAPVPASRSVRTVFSVGEETADDRIVGILEDRHEEAPVVVVTGDRELGDRCAAHGADVVGADTFLDVVRG